MGAFLYSFMNIHPVFKNKWFWIGILFLFIFSILFDIVVGSTVLVKSLASGKWDRSLLLVGVFYSVITAYKPFAEIRLKRSLTVMGRMTILISAIWSLQLYGFFSMIYFLVTIIILAKIIGWILKLLVRKKQAPSEIF